MKIHRIEIFAVLNERQVGKIRREWAWHALARNGRKLGWSGESYTRRVACIVAMEEMTDAHKRGIPVRVVDE